MVLVAYMIAYLPRWRSASSVTYLKVIHWKSAGDGDPLEVSAGDGDPLEMSAGDGDPLEMSALEVSAGDPLEVG